jgi:hypothetical protein
MRTYSFVISCPVMLPNSVTSPVPYATKVGTGAWRAGGVEPSGYPVQARFYVGAPRPLVPSAVPPALGPGKSPSVPPRRTVTTSGENPYVIAARQILDQSQVEKIRGEVLCVAYLRPYTGSKPLIDPATDGSSQRLIDPPAHLSSPKVFTTSVRGREYKYAWIQSSAALSPPLVGGMAFFDDKGQLAVVTFNVAGLTAKWRDRCTNKHHAEMQLVEFVNAQPVEWRQRLAVMELHNYSRRGPNLGYSACNACLDDLAGFLRSLNQLPRTAPIKASISWERLYNTTRQCGHRTDAANIRRLCAAGWDPPQGPMPIRAGESGPCPVKPRAPANPTSPPRSPVFTA